MRSVQQMVIIVLVLAAATGAVAQDDAIHVPVPEGWTAADQEYRFDRENLWEYINGAAELFLTYGFRELIVQDIEQGELFLSISVYDMSRPLDAFGVYETEQPKDGKTLANVGAAAVLQPPYRGLMHKDRFYVKVEVGGDDVSADVLTDVLTAVADGLPGSNEMPLQFAVLPVNGRIPGTVAFAGRNYMGLSDLTSCLHADYKLDDDQECSLFVMKPSQAFMRAIGERWDSEKRSDNSLLVWREVPYSGVVVLLGNEEKMIGVSGFEDRDKAIAVLESLKVGK